MVESLPTIGQLPDPSPKQTGWPWTKQTDPLSESQRRGEYWPRISIVTPSYNQGQFIEETIRSVLLQGYPNLEYYVVDGGSDDGSVEIIEKYSDWITKWVSEPDNGQSDAINKGFRWAGDGYYNWLNSDDCLLPNSLLSLGRILRCDHDIDWVTGARLLNDVRNGTRRIRMHWATNWVHYTMGVPAFPQDATFFSSDIWKQTGGLDESLRWTMDVQFFSEMLDLTSKGVFTEVLLSKMNVHDQQKTLNQGDGARREARAVNQATEPDGMLDRVLRRLMATRFGPWTKKIAELVKMREAQNLFRVASYNDETWDLRPFRGA